jgi:predicted DNA binding CopG/RHH family protein
LAVKKKLPLDDADDVALITSFKRGEAVPVRGRKKAIALAKQAAVAFRKKKDARVNIRLSEDILHGLKIRAAEEGLPYQTLIASVLHKFVKGRLVNKRV